MKVRLYEGLKFRLHLSLEMTYFGCPGADVPGDKSRAKQCLGYIFRTIPAPVMQPGLSISDKIFSVKYLPDQGDCSLVST